MEIKEDIMSRQRVKKLLRPLIPVFPIDLRRRLYRAADIWPVTRLKFRSHPTLTYGQLTSLTDRVLSVDEKISCAHTHHEIADVLSALLTVKPETQGCIVEAGCKAVAQSSLVFSPPCFIAVCSYSTPLKVFQSTVLAEKTAG